MALTSVETYHNPDNEAAVVQLLQKYEDSALIVAGGTFLHGLAARGLLSGVEALIDIQNLDLKLHHGKFRRYRYRRDGPVCSTGRKREYRAGAVAGRGERRDQLPARPDHEFRDRGRFHRGILSVL